MKKFKFILLSSALIAAVSLAAVAGQYRVVLRGSVYRIGNHNPDSTYVFQSVFTQYPLVAECTSNTTAQLIFDNSDSQTNTLLIVCNNGTVLCTNALIFVGQAKTNCTAIAANGASFEQVCRVPFQFVSGGYGFLTAPATGELIMDATTIPVRGGTTNFTLRCNGIFADSVGNPGTLSFTAVSQFKTGAVVCLPPLKP